MIASALTLERFLHGDYTRRALARSENRSADGDLREAAGPLGAGDGEDLSYAAARSDAEHGRRLDGLAQLATIGQNREQQAGRRFDALAGGQPAGKMRSGGRSPQNAGAPAGTGGLEASGDRRHISSMRSALGLLVGSACKPGLEDCPAAVLGYRLSAKRATPGGDDSFSALRWRALRAGRASQGKAFVSRLSLASPDARHHFRQPSGHQKNALSVPLRPPADLGSLEAYSTRCGGFPTIVRTCFTASAVRRRVTPRSAGAFNGPRMPSDTPWKSPAIAT